MWLKLLDLLLLLVPVLIEWWKKERSPGEKAADYVKAKQAETLATYEALLAPNASELNRLSRTRISAVRYLLQRVSQIREPPNGNASVPTQGTELPPSGG